jgi:hypothetical protein
MPSLCLTQRDADESLEGDGLAHRAGSRGLLGVQSGTTASQRQCWLSPVPGAAKTDGGGGLGQKARRSCQWPEPCARSPPSRPTHHTWSEVRCPSTRPAAGTPPTQTGALATGPPIGRHMQGMRQRSSRRATVQGLRWGCLRAVQSVCRRAGAGATRHGRGP